MQSAKNSSPVRVLITSSKAGDLAQVASAVKKLGLRVESVLEELGVITGQIDAERLPDLEQIPGISIERDEPVQLPPPDASVQ